MGYIYFISEDEYNQYRKRWYKKCSENNIEEDEIFESFLVKLLKNKEPLLIDIICKEIILI